MKKFILGLILFFSFYYVDALEINSRNYVLYNMNDNQVILEKGMDEQISIASLTKIMTVITAIENIKNIDEKVIITSNDFKNLYELDAATAGLYVGEEVTYRDLLYCTLLASGAECAQSLANNVAGDLASFVNMMNDKAKKIGLTNTHYENVIGLDDNGHFSSVQDVATLLKYALNNQEFIKIFQTKEYLTSDGYLEIESTYWQTAYKYGYDNDFVKGAKTGYTDDAGKCLASIATDKINNIDYLLVTCGADVTTKDAFHVKDAYNIYKYYFENYKYQTLVKNGNLVLSLNTKYSSDKIVNFYIDKDIKYYLDNDYDKDLVKIKYDGIDTITYKNKKGEKLGTISFYYDNVLIDTYDIILNDEYKFSIWVFLVDTKIIYGLSAIPIIIVLGILIYKKK